MRVPSTSTRSKRDPRAAVPVHRPVQAHERRRARRTMPLSPTQRHASARPSEEPGTGRLTSATSTSSITKRSAGAERIGSLASASTPKSVKPRTRQAADPHAVGPPRLDSGGEDRVAAERRVEDPRVASPAPHGDGRAAERCGAGRRRRSPRRGRGRRRGRRCRRGSARPSAPPSRASPRTGGARARRRTAGGSGTCRSRARSSCACAARAPRAADRWSTRGSRRAGPGKRTAPPAGPSGPPGRRSPWPVRPGVSRRPGRPRRRSALSRRRGRGSASPLRALDGSAPPVEQPPGVAAISSTCNSVLTQTAMSTASEPWRMYQKS